MMAAHHALCFGGPILVLRNWLSMIFYVATMHALSPTIANTCHRRRYVERLCVYCYLHTANYLYFLPLKQAILFYASSINWHDLPLPRQPNQIWALLHEESPRNVLEFLFEETLQHFNYTSTFSRYSDFPLTINALPTITEITNPKYVVTIGRKNVARGNIAPILFLQSDCSTMSARTNYVEELMQYIPIDSYGSCLNNRQMPDR